MLSSPPPQHHNHHHNHHHHPRHPHHHQHHILILIILMVSHLLSSSSTALNLVSSSPLLSSRFTRTFTLSFVDIWEYLNFCGLCKYFNIWIFWIWIFEDIWEYLGSPPLQHILGFLTSAAFALYCSLALYWYLGRGGHLNIDSPILISLININCFTLLTCSLLMIINHKNTLSFSNIRQICRVDIEITFWFEDTVKLFDIVGDKLLVWDCVWRADPQRRWNL